MADIVDKATRSRMMSGIRSRNTRPEMKVRSALHRAGYRFRLHVAGLPGKPDLVFAKHRAVIFVHGCYWHRHEGCPIASTPSTNREFWDDKFDANVKRDRQAREALQSEGWRVAVVWECETRKQTAESIAARWRMAYGWSAITRNSLMRVNQTTLATSSINDGGGRNRTCRFWGMIAWVGAGLCEGRERHFYGKIKGAASCCG